MKTRAPSSAAIRAAAAPMPLQPVIRTTLLSSRPIERFRAYEMMLAAIFT